MYSSAQNLNNYHSGAVLMYRLYYGIKSIFLNPLKLLPLALLVAAFLMCWNHRYLILPVCSAPLDTIYRYLISILIVLFFILFFFAAVSLCGTPLGAEKYRRAFSKIKFSAADGSVPVLISQTRLKHTRAKILTFYSFGIPKQKWEIRNEELQDALNMRFVEDIRYGGKYASNSHLITITAINGRGSNSTEVLYDDEL